MSKEHALTNLAFLNEGAEAPNVQQSEAELQHLSELVKTQIAMEGNVEEQKANDIYRQLSNDYLNELSIKTLEKVLSLFQADLRKIKQEKIPSYLNKFQLNQIGLESGYSVSVVEKYKGSIPNNNMQIAKKNMIENAIENGMKKEDAKKAIESLFNEKIELDYSREKVRELLEKGEDFDLKQSIHWATLNKYCKDQLTSGKGLPDGINCFQYQESKITKKK